MFYRTKGTIGNDLSLHFAARGLRGAVSPPVGPGGEAPEDLEILHFTVPR